MLAGRDAAYHRGRRHECETLTETAQQIARDEEDTRMHVERENQQVDAGGD
jgi:hypothetical protein